MVINHINPTATIAIVVIWKPYHISFAIIVGVTITIGVVTTTED